MKKAFRMQDEKSDKFWNIDYSGDDFSVNFGKSGSIGKFEIKEFIDEGACAAQAAKLIGQKQKKGYVECEFDYNAHSYFDDPEIGLHRKTSHPKFTEHFTADFYYDCTDEEAPFGSDEGADVLYEIEERFRKKQNFDFVSFPQQLVENIWEMQYISESDLDSESISALLEEGEDEVLQSDRVTYSCAFAQIKATGKVAPRLKERAITAMKRYKIVARKLEWETDLHVIDTMISDLERFS